MFTPQAGFKLWGKHDPDQLTFDFHFNRFQEMIEFVFFQKG
jgi:hypothetical protein